MPDMMSFPDTWQEFVNQYQFKDKEEVYTNGSELIPVFRVEQMMEHYCPQLCPTDFNKFPYVVGQPAEINLDGIWVKGRICKGYRYMDGIVTIETEDGQYISCPEAREDLYRPLTCNCGKECTCNGVNVQQ